MDWLEFSSSLASSLGWPIACVVIALLFKAPIEKLANKIHRLGFAGFSMEISQKLDEAETIAAEDAPKTQRAANLGTSELAKILKYPPDYTVIYEWRKIELTLRDIAGYLGIDRRSSPIITARALLERALIKSTTVELMRDLSVIRNGAAHGEVEVSQADSLRFVNLARVVMTELERVIEALNSKQKNPSPPTRP